MRLFHTYDIGVDHMDTFMSPPSGSKEVSLSLTVGWCEGEAWWTLLTPQFVLPSWSSQASKGCLLSQEALSPASLVYSFQCSAFWLTVASAMLCQVSFNTDGNRNSMCFLSGLPSVTWFWKFCANIACNGILLFLRMTLLKCWLCFV